MAVRNRDSGGNTASRVLDVGEQLVQKRGFNAFSYADVAAELHVTKAALHYHFAGKAELGQAILNRYVERFKDALVAIEAEPAETAVKLRAYADLYLEVLRNQRMCLCGMLAAEFETLPAPMQAIVIDFFNDNETWLAAVLERGREEGSLHFSGSARETARFVVAALEGAMLVARPYRDVARFKKTVASLLAGLGNKPALD